VCARRAAGAGRRQLCRSHGGWARRGVARPRVPTALPGAPAAVPGRAAPWGAADLAPIPGCPPLGACPCPGSASGTLQPGQGCWVLCKMPPHEVPLPIPPRRGGVHCARVDPGRWRQTGVGAHQPVALNSGRWLLASRSIIRAGEMRISMKSVIAASTFGGGGT